VLRKGRRTGFFVEGRKGEGGGKIVACIDIAASRGDGKGCVHELCKLARIYDAIIEGLVARVSSFHLG